MILILLLASLAEDCNVVSGSPGHAGTRHAKASTSPRDSFVPDPGLPLGPPSSGVEFLIRFAALNASSPPAGAGTQSPDAGAALLGL
jgi:hypothetical protein